MAIKYLNKKDITIIITNIDIAIIITNISKDITNRFSLKTRDYEPIEKKHTQTLPIKSIPQKKILLTHTSRSWKIVDVILKDENA